MSTSKNNNFSDNSIENINFCEDTVNLEISEGDENGNASKCNKENNLNRETDLKNENYLKENSFCNFTNIDAETSNISIKKHKHTIKAINDILTRYNNTIFTHPTSPYITHLLELARHELFKLRKQVLLQQTLNSNKNSIQTESQLQKKSSKNEFYHNMTRTEIRRMLHVVATITQEITELEKIIKSDKYQNKRMILYCGISSILVLITIFTYFWRLFYK